MSNIDIVRAWKDPEYRRSLSETELENVPAHPSGVIELKDAELDAVAGGGGCTCCCNRISCGLSLCATR